MTNLNGSEDTVVFSGCGPNFIETISKAPNFIAASSRGIIHEKTLDYSFESIKQIDRFINTEKSKGRLTDSQFHCACVAYIGEIIRRKINAKWDSYHLQDENGDRYFPVLIPQSGKSIEIYGQVEKNLSQIEESTLASYVANIEKPFVLKVEKITPPIFPLSN